MGRSLHVPGFCCECHGFFLDTPNGKSITIIKPGKNADGYWCNSDLAKQLEEVLPLFAELHPDCELSFCFDNSQNHHARKPDALWAWNLNLSDRGKNFKSLRDTEYNGRIHSMQREDGVQKGI